MSPQDARSTELMDDGIVQGEIADSTGVDAASIAADSAASSATTVRTPWSEFWRKFRRQHVAVVAGGFVLLLVAIAIIAPWIVPYDAETYFDYDSLNALPSAKHWFGVDSLGRDIRAGSQWGPASR